MPLPDDVNDQENIFVRWLSDDADANQGYTAIDDIIITGEAIPSGILIESTATGTGSLIHNNTEVEATVERYVGATDGDWEAADNSAGWHLVSSPVIGQAISGLWTPDGESENDYDFYAWNEAEQEWKNQKIPANEIDEFVPGQGYLIAYQAATTNLFEGEINVGSIVDIALTNSGADGHYGWNLLGNPYASALEWSTGWTLTNVGGTAKIWHEGNKSYSDIVAEDPIPAMNGFFVYASEATTLTIPVAARVHDATPWYKKGGDNQLRLIAREDRNNSAQETIIRFIWDATTGFDLKYDAYFLPGYAPMMYALAEGSRLSTYTLPELHREVVVPIGFVKNNATDFTIELGHAQLDGNYDVLLHDKKLDVTHNLSVDGAYGFTSDSRDNHERFEVRFELDVTGIDEPADMGLGNAWLYDNMLYVYSVEDGTQVALYDLSGRMLQSWQTQSGQQGRYVDLPSGVYVVRMTGSTATKSVKVVVR